jgi:hypothetical protein
MQSGARGLVARALLPISPPDCSGDWFLGGLNYERTGPEEISLMIRE